MTAPWGGKAVALLAAAVVLALSAPAAATTKKTTAAKTTAKPASRAFVADVWADNWFALYANGVLVGQDSVPITTERSFNSEHITFRATYPLTVGIVAKDYVQDASGLEYIGTPRQQIGDGGVIAQVRDAVTGKVVAATGDAWRGLVLQRAPLDPSCERSADPSTACAQQTRAAPANWSTPGFDDHTWLRPTTYTAEEVGAKDGYFSVRWGPTARLVWSNDLRLDNVLLLRSPPVRGA